MSTSFLTLPREIRDRVYELCLLHQGSVDPWNDFFERQSLSPGLLCTNKTVHGEASLLLYAKNHFDFTSATSEEVSSFLGAIGRNNADHIRHIRIRFPSLCDLKPGNVTLGEDSDGILTNIQSSCADLKTLTTSLYTTHTTERMLNALDDPKIVTEALTLVNTRFKAISSLQDIIVEVYKGGSGDYIRREMENFGWKTSATEYIEEWASDRSFGNSDGDWGYDHDYDDYDDNDYDIDNDSDFWRRAADD